MTLQELRTIALHAAKGTVPTTYANQDVDMNQAFVDGLNEYAGSINQFMKNRYDIYDIIVKTIDDIVPKRVIDSMSEFAEIQQVPQGQKAIFKKRVGKLRARKFLTQVGLSGVYETFRLDKETFELPALAVGGGVTIDFERMLDGTESLSDVMEAMTQGLSDAIFLEVQKALRASLDNAKRPAANKVTSNTFESDKMFKLTTVARAYGNGAIIFAPQEFVGAMGPDAIVATIAGAAQGIYHPDDIDAIHRDGYITMFRGTPVIRIPQSYIDKKNVSTWIDPQIAYVFPTGGEKVVKVVLEGDTQIHDFKNRDNSLEVYIYKKMGCGIIYHHNWCIYKNTGITQTYVNPYTDLD